MLKRAGHAETLYILGIIEFLLVLAPFAIWIGRGHPPNWKVWVGSALTLSTLIFAVMIIGFTTISISDYFNRRRQEKRQ